MYQPGHQRISKGISDSSTALKTSKDNDRQDDSHFRRCQRPLSIQPSGSDKWSGWFQTGSDSCFREIERPRYLYCPYPARRNNNRGQRWHRGSGAEDKQQTSQGGLKNPLKSSRSPLLFPNENSVTTLGTQENNGRSDAGFVFQFHFAVLAVVSSVHTQKHNFSCNWCLLG